MIFRHNLGGIVIKRYSTSPAVRNWSLTNKCSLLLYQRNTFFTWFYYTKYCFLIQIIPKQKYLTHQWNPDEKDSIDDDENYLKVNLGVIAMKLFYCIANNC